jgi:glutathione synthase/RimK-type ligase-like ATP-grasp enzyme
MGIKLENVLACANKIYTERKFGKHGIHAPQALIMPSDQIHAIATAMCEAVDAELDKLCERNHLTRT